MLMRQPFGGRGSGRDLAPAACVDSPDGAPQAAEINPQPAIAPSPAGAPAPQARSGSGTAHRLRSVQGGTISIAADGFLVHHDPAAQTPAALVAVSHPRLQGILLLVSLDAGRSIRVDHDPLEAQALDFFADDGEAGCITLRSPRNRQYVSCGPLSREQVRLGSNRREAKGWEQFRLAVGETPPADTLAAHLIEALDAAPPQQAGADALLDWLESIDQAEAALLLEPLMRPFGRDEKRALRMVNLLAANKPAPAAEGPPSGNSGARPGWASSQPARYFDGPMFLLDSRGRIVGHDPEQDERPLQPLTSFETAKALQLHGVRQPPDSNDAFIFSDLGIMRQHAMLPGVGLVALAYDPTQRCWQVRHPDGRLLVVDENAGRCRFSADASEARSAFLLLTEADIRKLRHVLGSRWVARRDKQIHEGIAIRLADDFILRIGRFSLDLRFQDFSRMDHYSLVGAVDGWKYEKFYLYRPLVYITAYSDRHVLDQLKLCIASLLKIGRFAGRIVVMTDVGRDEILRLCEPDDPDQIVVLPLRPVDFVGYVCTKYMIYDSELFHGYQPVMYLDPDIIFDRPADEMLVPVASCEKISAPLEDFHFLRNHPAVGSSLLQLDGIEPIYAAGFNGGTIVIPNVANPAVRECFDLIRRTIGSLGVIHGRGFNRWADQECANYVGFKTGMVDTSVLTRHVQHHVAQPLDTGRRGLVHFWAHAGSRKVVLMRNYFYSLLAADGVAVVVMLLQWAERDA